ncbi:MAG TPA: bacteriohemerythrin [Bryobacteraceae bacterium]|nr:bacteriohemerythrin [Bryobacteraceae bacterium]
MALFDWSENYGVHRPEIDGQHKRRFALAHKLHVAAVTGQGQEVLSKLLADFIAYTEGHFASEERLMLAKGYPAFVAHKIQHETIVDDLVDLQRKFELGRANLTLEVLQHLKTWLTEHIAGADQQMGAFLEEKRS